MMIRSVPSRRETMLIQSQQDWPSGRGMET